MGQNIVAHRSLKKPNNPRKESPRSSTKEPAYPRNVKRRIVFHECARIVFFIFIYLRGLCMIEQKMSLIPTLFGNSKPFSMDIWDPFQGFPFFGQLNNARGEVSAFSGARFDWKETPEAHVFKADLPGLNKEEVKVEVEEGGVLNISGERSREKEEKNDKWHLVERSSGKFLRRFRLPEDAKVEEIKAAMENGVLTVTVPKVEIKIKTRQSKL